MNCKISRLNVYEVKDINKLMLRTKYENIHHVPCNNELFESYLFRKLLTIKQLRLTTGYSTL